VLRHDGSGTRRFRAARVTRVPVVGITDSNALTLVCSTIERVPCVAVGTADDHLRVRFERGVRWLLEQYRSESTRALVNKARLAAAQLLAPPDIAPGVVPPREAGPPVDREAERHDVLAGLCGGVALRDLNLVDSLLAQLEAMEANEGDPEALAQLYQLDHVAARLRRNAENLRVLAGHDAGSAANVASPLVDVIRAAMSSIEQYSRIEIGRVASQAVVDFAVDDLSRVLAELLDNATSHSSPTSKVSVDAHPAEQGGVLLRIEDAGIGLPAARLEALNNRLSAAPKLDSGSIEHMGLAVVRRLAGKHGIRVRLEKRAVHGTTATVLLPANLVCEAPATPWFAGVPTTTIPRPRTAPARVSASLPPSSRMYRESTEHSNTRPTPRTTRNGLPRRVPQSMREFAGFASAGPSRPEDSNFDPGEGRAQLMTDLGDFAEGEQAARRGARSAEGDRAEESQE
jgi:signal transduction histidine kinase